MHISVLKNQVIEHFSYLGDRDKFVFVDGTLGAAGHTLAIAETVGKNSGTFLGIDKDQSALNLAKANIEKASLPHNFLFAHDDFKNINDILGQNKIDNIDGALIDLGVSSMQLDLPERGFSFKNPDQKLDMRMDQSQEKSAFLVVNFYPERELERIFREYGEEKFARQIARNIAKRRDLRKIVSIADLIEVISSSIPTKNKFGRIHFATRVFQAIRIEVNDELAELDQAINDYVDRLNVGGRIAIISFHSLEDRIVKDTFRILADPCQCPRSLPCICGKTPKIKILTKKPIIASEEEIGLNPRSRSAKLRIAEKI